MNGELTSRRTEDAARFSPCMTPGNPGASLIVLSMRRGRIRNCYGA
jgi:hypothetical protein